MGNQLKMLGVTGLFAGILMVSGCGGGGSDPAPVNPELQTVVVATSSPTAQPFDAATKQNTFEISVTSDYSYSVVGFAAGDKLVFPAGTAIHLQNTNGADRLIDEITGTLDGKAVTVYLTGIAAASDGNIFGVDSFNTVFGAGSLVAK